MTVHAALQRMYHELSDCACRQRYAVGCYCLLTLCEAVLCHQGQTTAQ